MIRYKNGKPIEDKAWYDYEVNRLKKEFDNNIKQLRFEYADVEVETWGVKNTEAEKVINGQESEYITALANTYGMTPEDMAKHILERGKEYADAYIKYEADYKDKLEQVKTRYNNFINSN